MSILNAPEGLIKLLVKKYDLFEVSIAKDFGQRFAECQKCTESTFCPGCGCVKEAKALIEREKCPKNLWPLT